MSNLQSADEVMIKTDKIVVTSSPAMKAALAIIARRNCTTVAGIIRSLIFKYVDSEYPSFEEVYLNELGKLLERDHND